MHTGPFQSGQGDEKAGKAGQAREKGGQVRKNPVSKEDSAVPGETARVGRAGEGTVAVAARTYIVSEGVRHHHNIIIINL